MSASAPPPDAAPALLPPPLSLYIHIPWCVRKCPYCDFNSHGLKGTMPVDDYVAALLADLEQDLPLAWGRTVHSVFFGGGTPSLFPPGAIGAILEGASSRLRFAPDIEITLETNPGTAEHGRFRGYQAAGVNRLSFGVQSFDDGCLQRLGRIHDSAEAEAAVKLAQDDGFDNINLDLMFALPGQDASMAELDVQRAIALAPAHISHYQLTLEPNTVFFARPPAGLPDDDQAWETQQRCQALLADAGYAQYEVSAYARAQRRCRHNLNYWSFGDYLGIGAGAHGKLSLGHDGTILRRHKQRHPRAYMDHAGGTGRIAGEERVAAAQRPFEFMLNALRLVDGFSAERFEHRTGLALATIQAPLRQAIEAGWLVHEDGRFRPTGLGQRFNNDLVSLFLD